MAQTSYTTNMAVSMAGLLADSRENTIESFAANGSVPFGYGVVGDPGDTKKVQLPSNDVATLVFDGDFVASNSIVITVNDVATDAVVFATDQDTTAEAVRAAIEGLSTVKSATLTDTGGDNRTFRIESVDDTAITVSEAITGGAGQATGTVTYSTDNILRGIAAKSHREQDADGTVEYKDGDAVNVVRQGQLWVPVTVAVTADDTAYIIASGADAGKFTNVSTNNIATGGKFRSSTTGAGLAKTDINLP